MPCQNGQVWFRRICGLSLSDMLSIFTMPLFTRIKWIHPISYSPAKMLLGPYRISEFLDVLHMCLIKSYKMVKALANGGQDHGRISKLEHLIVIPTIYLWFTICLDLIHLPNFMSHLMNIFIWPPEILTLHTVHMSDFIIHLPTGCMTTNFQTTPILFILLAW